MKKTVLIAALLLWCSFSGAQVITSVVCDQDTKRPISNVYVYLDGTSINTITNDSGIFELKTSSVINTGLVIYHMSYETAFIDRPFEGIPDTLYIKERMNIIEEITIRADIFTREQKMKAFREQFLGMSRAGMSCTIENEDDIEFWVDTQTQTLFAWSDKPIEVVNDYLGYKVSFILVDFWVQYHDITNRTVLRSPTDLPSALNSSNVHNMFFAVVSLFTDTAPDNRRIKRRRDNVYEQSPNYFFKSFVNDDLRGNNFTIYNGSLPANPQNYFAIKDTLSQKMISIIPDTDINRDRASFTETKPSGIISVLYRRNVRSDIYFMTDSFLVDRYGNIDQFDKISFSGQMGENRAGGMLPMDYE